MLDFDHDGDLDLAINHNPGDAGDAGRGAAVLLRNDVGSRRAWLALELVGRESNRDAVGAVARLEAGGLTALRRVDGGSGYASQHGRRLHFGLGDAERVDRLEVRWPSGRRQVFGDLPARRLVRLVEGGAPEIGDLPAGREPVATGREPDAGGGP